MPSLHMAQAGAAPMPQGPGLLAAQQVGLQGAVGEAAPKPPPQAKAGADITLAVQLCLNLYGMPAKKVGAAEFTESHDTIHQLLAVSLIGAHPGVTQVGLIGGQIQRCARRLRVHGIEGGLGCQHARLHGSVGALQGHEGTSATEFNDSKSGQGQRVGCLQHAP